LCVIISLKGKKFESIKPNFKAIIGVRKEAEQAGLEPKNIFL